jgi:hypothetical protein
MSLTIKEIALSGSVAANCARACQETKKRKRWEGEKKRAKKKKGRTNDIQAGVEGLKHRLVLVRLEPFDQDLFDVDHPHTRTRALFSSFLMWDKKKEDAARAIATQHSIAHSKTQRKNDNAHRRNGTVEGTGGVARADEEFELLGHRAQRRQYHPADAQSRGGLAERQRHPQPA